MPGTSPGHRVRSSRSRRFSSSAWGTSIRKGRISAVVLLSASGTLHEVGGLGSRYGNRGLAKVAGGPHFARDGRLLLFFHHPRLAGTTGLAGPACLAVPTSRYRSENEEGEKSEHHDDATHEKAASYGAAS